MTDWLAASAGGGTLRVLILTSFGLAVLAAGFTLAAIIGRWRNARNEAREAALTATWEQPVLDVLSGRRSTDSVQRLVRPREALYFVEFLSSLARRLPAGERGPLVLLAAPFIDRLTTRLTHHDEYIRIRAVQTLSLLALDLHATKLIQALDDQSTLVALHAARALAHGGHADLAPPVLQRLARFTQFHPPIVAAVVSGLGLDAVPALLAAYADERQPAAARVILAGALRILQAPDAADVATRLLGSAPYDLVGGSLRVLEELGSERHLDAVRPLLDHADEFVRVRAIAAFAALAGPQQLAELAPKLDDPSPWAALQAARALRAWRGGELLRQAAAGTGQRALLAAEGLAGTA